MQKFHPDKMADEWPSTKPFGRSKWEIYFASQTAGQMTHIRDRSKSASAQTQIESALSFRANIV
jgi:hypothetical protein